jgi:peptidoglycan/xylan/chitin deacetylase (PgdA/CDA1 family)
MKRQAKQLLFRAAQSTGALAFMAGSRWRTERLLILGYHGVSLSDEHDWNPFLFVTAEQLDERLSAIRAGGYTILPLDEAIRRLHDRTLPRRSVALTFDDGLYNFYAAALPVLQRHQVPATVYLSTYYVDYNRPVPYVAASYLLWRKRQSSVRIHSIPGFSNIVDLNSSIVRAEVHRAFVQFAESKRLSAKDKDELFRSFAADLGVDYDVFADKERIMTLMTAEQVRDVAGTGLIQVELHTHRHRVPLEPALFSREICENRERIVSMTGRTPSHFCYPSGVFEKRFFPWLSDVAIKSATTCVNGLAAPGMNPLLLPRFIDHSKATHLEFEAWLAGFAQYIPSRHAIAS